jgi:enamine deaminase RidA (YjgF/YER057c/UK114 family)
MRRISTGSRRESRLGCSQAVVAGGMVFVSATAATGSDGSIIGKDSVLHQARIILDKIKAVLVDTGSSLDNVVQTRIYLADIARSEEVGRAHAEAFAGNGPALSLVHVKPFHDPDILVEIEAVALTGG